MKKLWYRACSMKGDGGDSRGYRKKLLDRCAYDLLTATEPITGDYFIGAFIGIPDDEQCKITVGEFFEAIFNK